MGSVSKAQMYDLSREVVAHAVDTWWKNAERNIRVWSILLDDMEINEVKVVFVCGIDGEILVLEVAEGAGREGLMGGNN